MRSVKYKIVKLDTPDGRITHKLEYESVSKLSKNSGGYNCGVLFRGTYKECKKRKDEYANGI